MLSKEELKRIRDFCDSSQNPLFFFDNDVDGLASFLLLRRFIDRGKGVVIKSYPDLNATYIRKLHEIRCDTVFILDKPLVAPSFFEAAFQLSLPIIWIDHHQPQNYEGINYFNPLLGKPATSEPTSYWCYKVAAKKEDEWIAMLGCLADYFLPEFSKSFAEPYHDIFQSHSDPGKILFGTEFGKLTKVLAFSLKDKTINVLRMMKYMFNIKSPYELIHKDTKEAAFIYSRFERINRKYMKLVEKASMLGEKSERVVFFSYGGDLSISADIANELLYKFPKKMIVVAYLKGEKANISLRDSKLDLRIFLDKVMQDIESTYGGHEHACGATIAVSDLPKFKENLMKAVAK